MNRLWDFLIRFRTWLLGVAGVIIMVLPAETIVLVAQLLDAPEIVSVLPEGWKPWAAAIGFVLMTWSRWRPASRAADPEVQVKLAIEETPAPSTIKVIEGGETKAVIHG